MFSDLYACLQPWPSTLFLHATLTSNNVISLLRYTTPFPPSWNVMEQSRTLPFYTSLVQRFIVQGYTPHKCIKCACCMHSKGTKKSPTFAWSQLNPSPWFQLLFALYSLEDYITLWPCSSTTRSLYFSYTLILFCCLLGYFVDLSKLQINKKSILLSSVCGVNP